MLTNLIQPNEMQVDWRPQSSVGTKVKGAKWEVCACVLAGIPRGLCACMRGGVRTDVCAHVCVPSVRRKERDCLSV